MANILLCCGASVAIYKACDLASKLVQAGHVVRTVLTPTAAELISPQLFEAVTGEIAAVSEYGPARKGAMDHIQLGAWAELVLVAPASADLIARLAHGMAGDLLTTAVLACPSTRPRLISPAMNPGMLAQPAVRRNLEQLRQDGWTVVEPESGHMACGDEGQGRLPEPAALVRRVAELLKA
ncbi:MAG TPA: flavoprotein [Planctomycetota bacterium]|nr:flavoprotein [Planctomycetota bacterium]